MPTSEALVFSVANQKLVEEQPQIFRLRKPQKTSACCAQDDS
jgi:hypothetical protein